MKHFTSTKVTNHISLTGSLFSRRFKDSTENKVMVNQKWLHIAQIRKTRMIRVGK